MRITINKSCITIHPMILWGYPIIGMILLDISKVVLLFIPSKVVMWDRDESEKKGWPSTIQRAF